MGLAENRLKNGGTYTEIKAPLFGVFFALLLVITRQLKLTAKTSLS